MTPEEESIVSRWQLSMVEKLVGGVIMGLLVWMAATTQSTSTRMAVIEAKLSMMAADPYSSADAAKDKQISDEKIAAISARLETLEKRNMGGME